MTATAERQRDETRDTILYALGVAQGPDAWDERHLRFVDEDRLPARVLEPN